MEGRETNVAAYYAKAGYGRDRGRHGQRVWRWWWRLAVRRGEVGCRAVEVDDGWFRACAWGSGAVGAKVCGVQLRTPG
jgi:hypothetical protein